MRIRWEGEDVWGEEAGLCVIDEVGGCVEIRWDGVYSHVVQSNAILTRCRSCH